MDENSIKDLIAFFGTPDKPVTTSEFMTFWKDLPQSEKDYYKAAALA